MSSRRALIGAIALAVACGPKPDPPLVERPAGRKTTEAETVSDQQPSTMSIALSDAAPSAGAGARNPVAPAPAVDLTSEETDAVLARLPPLQAAPEDAASFAKRQESKPPPRAGETVQTPFPPPADRARPEVAARPPEKLEVLRRQPEGETPVAPHLSVTFNQPMVTIASHADTIAENVPVRLDPQPEGQWRWVGTRTLLFEPGREGFPMATEYTATVREGTKSATGASLSETVSWKFGTPPPTVVQTYPGDGTYDRNQLLFVRFDQRVDPPKVLAHLKVTTGGLFSRQIAMKVAEPDRVEADETVANLVRQAPEGHYVVAEAVEPLPYDAKIRVVVKEGTPSAEGPRSTLERSRFSFRTYGPLEVAEHECGYRGCHPNDAFSFYFTNELDTESIDASLITVEPPIPGMSVSTYGTSLSISGEKVGRQKYEVTLDPRITDRFGQPLQGRRTFRFRVKAAEPELQDTNAVMTVLEPSQKPSYSVFTTNYDELEVTAWEVEPKDWGQYLLWFQDYQYYGKKEVRPPGREVFSRSIPIAARPDELVETKIPLHELLPGGKGNAVLFVRPTSTSRGSKMPEYPGEIRIWLQSTNIGLDAFVDSTEFIAWATALDSGAPLSGVELELLVTGQRQKTDAGGLATIALTAATTAYEGRPNILIGRHGDDVGFLPESLWGYASTTTWVKQPLPDSLAWFVFDDRGMYKPGQRVSIKGWVRAIENREQGTVKLAQRLRPIVWQAFDAQGVELARGKAKPSELGGFDFAFDLPPTPNLGPGYVSFATTADGASNIQYSHNFQIQEFRTPEFEVSASVPEGPFFAGDAAVATVDARYYAGGGLPDADVHWTVTGTQASFTPPNLHDYTFGSWTPWWMTPPTAGAAVTETFSAKTDATGSHALNMAFGEIRPPRPMTVAAQALVYDVNRQAWAASTSFLVHPSAHYVGLKTETYFVERGEPLVVDLVAADIDGKLLDSRPITVRAARLTQTYRNGEYVEEEVDPQTCEVATSAGKAQCSFATSVGGLYRITASIHDEKGRRNFSQVTRWVTGGKQPPARRVEQEAVTLVPGKREYRPGDTAEILVMSPFVPAEGLYTLQRNGIVEAKRFTMNHSTTTLSIPIDDTHFPNLRVQVDLVGTQPRLGSDGQPDEKLPPRPAYAQGAIQLDIPPHERRLAVALTPEHERVSPGASTWVDLEVRDAAGNPVEGSEVAVVIVDEAVLALSGYEMPDPIEIFYPRRPSGTRDVHSRAMVTLHDPNELAADKDADGVVDAVVGTVTTASRTEVAAMEEDAPSGGLFSKRKKSAQREMAAAPMAAEMAPAPQQPQQPIAVRSRFDALAKFVAALPTDAAGKARVEYQIPDNLTRYRIMAVAVASGTHYGTGEANVTARLPLMVRPSPPRFLNFGDSFELPIVVQNQTDAPADVAVALRGSNIELASAVGRKVTVPANDRVELRFAARTLQAGVARFQVAAATTTDADANEFNLPVWTPATSEAFASYGVVDEGAVVQPVAAPTDVWPQFGGLQVTTSSTALQSLTDAFIYLYDYPYQCAEQIASRMISVAALRDVLTAFEAEGMPSADAVRASMERDIDELQSRQNWDGGFGLWRAGEPSWPYVSLHAAHALGRAKQKGYDVDEHVIARARDYLRQVENHLPGRWPKWIRLHVMAYSLYVRNQLGDKDPAAARRVVKKAGDLEDLSFESVGWVLGTLTGQPGYEDDVAEIRRFLNNRVTETAAGAHFAANIADEEGYLIMQSDRVADGVILEALIEDQPKSDLIPKIVEGLLAHRTKGHWGNTQENAFVLLALDRYFNAYEKQTPDFYARVWLGDQFAGEHQFRGRTTERHHIDVPMGYVVGAEGSQNLLLQKDGKGRMYYRIGMSYAPKSLFLEPADHGFVVERRYEAVDDPSDVKRRSDGTWEIRAGATVRVDLTMVAPTRRYHVALVDPLPAGLETLNPALAVTQALPQDPNELSGDWWWWTRPWFEHQNMRDERTEAFTTLLWGGVHTYTYYARATTPGEFVVPPAKAEEMYHPETFGRSASDRVAVVN